MGVSAVADAQEASGSAVDKVPAAPQAISSGTAQPALKAVVEGGSDDFRFEGLLSSLGMKVTPEMTARIEARMLAQMDGPAGVGGKIYVIGMDANGGTVLRTDSGVLTAFSYAAKEVPAGNGDGVEAGLMQKFKAAGEIQAKVLDAVFDTVSIPVRKYVHHERGDIQAVAYVHGEKRVVTFLDSSKVELSKLLPRLPEKETVENLKKGLQKSQIK